MAFRRGLSLEKRGNRAGKKDMAPEAHLRLNFAPRAGPV